MRKCKYFIIDYAEDSFAPQGVPFLVILLCEDVDSESVHSFFVSDWRERLQISTPDMSRYISGFIARFRQINHMTEDDRRGFLDLIIGLSTGAFRTTFDGVCSFSDLDLIFSGADWQVDQVACSSEIFGRLLALLQPTLHLSQE